VNADDLRSLSDDDLRREQERIVERLSETSHAELLTYDQAAQRLGVKYERVAALVSQGFLIAEKHPRDARKWISSDQIAWYNRVRQGLDDVQNPALIRQEASRRAAQATTTMPAQPSDTLLEVRHYVESHMPNSEAATHLNAALTEIAQHLAGELVGDAFGTEPLPAIERARLSGLLAALTQKGDNAS
jgi:hypothetical protein